MALGQHAPGKRGGAASHDILQRLRGGVEHARHVVQLQLVRIHADQPVLERGDQPAQAGIGGDVLEQRPAPSKAVHCGLQLGKGQEQQTVAREEGQPRDIGDADEMGLVGFEALGQRLRRLRRQLRGRRVDHGDEGVEMVEGLFEHLLGLAPLQFRRQHGVDIGVDLEMRGGVKTAKHGDQEENRDNGARMAHAEPDLANNRGCQHMRLSLPCRLLDYLELHS